MTRFQRLAFDEAIAMTRGELLDRLDVEQQYWMRKIGRMSDSDADAVEEFRKIMHLVDPAKAVADALRYVRGEPGPSYWDQRPNEERS